MTDMTRRDMIALASAAMLLPGAAPAPITGPTNTTPFNWQNLLQRAEALSRTPHVEVSGNPAAAQIDYEAFHKAQFKDERTLWGDLPGATGIRFFPLSNTANTPVTIHTIDKGQASPVLYEPAMFDMAPDNPVVRLGPDAGFAGFRIMNEPRDADWLVFMGASYFRAAGAEKQYGISARAVAVDISKGKEEFPRFTTFWLERIDDKTVDIYALLDGPSLTGAYRFRNWLDDKGVHQDVEVTLFPRRAIAELGLMPMTSMFWYDQAHRPKAADWRPEIHDSDGLLIRPDDGTAAFRSLINPPAPRTTCMVQRDPKGFGLLQRDRNFDHYQDDGVFYERRPSLWATPAKPWGQGEIRLYEFPTDSEYTDNVTSYWTPARSVATGQKLAFSYRLDWQSAEPVASPVPGIVENVWRGTSDIKVEDGGRAVRLVVDFAGLGDRKGLQTSAMIAGGKLLKSTAYPVISRPGVWRSVLDLAPAGSSPIDVQLSLMQSGAMVTERFSYPLVP